MYSFITMLTSQAQKTQLAGYLIERADSALPCCNVFYWNAGAKTWHHFSCCIVNDHETKLASATARYMLHCP